MACCPEGLLGRAGAGHAGVLGATLRGAARAEIAIYRDVSLAVMAHLGRILGWRRPKAAVLAAGIRGVYAWERLGGGGRLGGGRRAGPGQAPGGAGPGPAPRAVRGGAPGGARGKPPGPAPGGGPPRARA